MGERPDRLGHETPSDEFPQGRGWNAADEEDPSMRDAPGLAGLENDIGVANRGHDGGLTDEELDAIQVDPATDDATESADSDDTEEIRDNIEETRANMSSTIDAIQEKLSPQRLAEQAKDTVREATVGRVQQMASNITETARDTGSTLMDTARRNPLPAALAGIGLGWLFMSARRTALERNHYRWQSGSRAQGRRSYEAPQQDNGQMGQVTDNVKDALGNVGDRAQDAAGAIGERASDMAEQAQWQAQRARGWMEQTWDENPLVVGGAALALGALVGLSVPGTQAEQQLMGEASGNVMQKAQDVTQSVTERAQQAMSDATPNSENASASDDTESSGAGGV